MFIILFLLAMAGLAVVLFHVTLFALAFKYLKPILWIFLGLIVLTQVLGHKPNY